MNCTHCSAKIQSDALTCPYCSHETPNFAKARALAEEQRRHAHQLSLIDASKARQAALENLASSAKTSFYWALAGVVVCCLPVGSIVGLLLGFRVRKTALALNVPVPWQATAASATSMLWLAFFLFAMILGAVSSHNKSVRVGALREATRVGASAVELDPQTACGLVELTLLEGGAGEKGGSLDLFRCEGIVERQGEGRAVIKDFEFSRRASDKPQRIDGCLSRGSRWRVDALGSGPGCETRDAGE